MKTARTTAGVAVMVLMAGLCGGCVRRTLTVRTEPEGARVWLNNQEIGTSPVTADFTWYGDYEVTLRKEGFQTLNTHHRLDAPWYQWPFIDFFAEVLFPFQVHDRRELPVCVLQPEVLPEPEELVQRAEELKERAVFGER